MVDSGRPTRRVGLALLVPVLAGVAALVFTAPPLRTGAQTGTPRSGNQRFVGTWSLTFETPLGLSRSLLTVMADGTAIFSGRPVRPEGAGVPVTFVSAGHGAWESTGADTAHATWVGFVSDAQGNFLAVATDSVEATLDPEGKAWRGAYSATVADPDGNVIYVGEGEVRATRITVQPLATPAPGTPAAGANA